jgi:hypothetical protein
MPLRGIAWVANKKSSKMRSIGTPCEKADMSVTNRICQANQPKKNKQV